ncbi:PREDICTED: uncharacterized protein LOC109220637 isoform X2 [Nicotiana attenuata]|uniref:uncharacterized protein LOC109220637 isoform X2 n=1 Tax=Nicotiana attenuata TaxID=49451 RepID=UPI00090504AC|nr:PREDICTED: uncharacterized protein LOC109220637 isoform X2 [Nicotiana attenuata]
MLSHISASLSHTSSTTTASFLLRRPFLRPKFLLCPYNPSKSQKRNRFVFSSMDSAATVDSVANDLKKQSLKGTENVDISSKLNLEELNWDNSFVRELPGDSRSDSIPREVLHACYTKVLPSVKVDNPQLVAWSESVAELLELDPKDGNPKDEPGAIVCRVAQSFLRFGSYQLHASRGKKDLEIVRALADYAIRYHFPHLENMARSESISFNTGEEDNSAVDLSSNKYAAWAVEVAERTASMIARWQGVGFTHGVMNTDNMSVLGLTIDYGPFGFLDAFDPNFTPNTTDLPGRRYCFANQPDVGLWNIAQFTSALSTADLLDDKEADYAMERYGDKFMDDYQVIMTRKLGLAKYNKKLISELLKNMAIDKVDYTNFFRLLSNIKADPTIPEDQLLIPLKAVLLDIGEERKEAWTSWVKSYIQELSTTGLSDEERKVSMNSVNPKYILRNYLCQTAIDAAEQGDFGEVRQLLKVMQCPFDEQPGMEKYARLPPAWAYRPGVCMLSCSS